MSLAHELRPARHDAVSATPRALLLFASALAGRSLAPAGPASTASGPGLLQLPATPAASTAQHRAQRIGLLRQVVAQQPGGRWAVDAAWQRALAQATRPRLLARLFHALEARRVDAALARQFPGARGDLAQALTSQASAPAGHWAPRLQACAAASAVLDDPAATALDSLQAAQQWLARLPAGRRHGTGQASALAMPAPPPPQAGPDASPGAAANTPAGHAIALDGPAQHGSAGGRSAALDAAASSAPARPGRQPDPLARARAHSPQARPDPSLTTTPPGTSGPSQTARPGPARQTHWHDEWHYTERRYLRHWVCVQVQAVQGRQAGWLADLQARHAPLLRQIRRHFSATPPTARQRGGAAVDGDQLDLDQALAALIARRAGSPDEARPYRHRPRLLRDVCTAVLLDTSGSTGFVVPPPPGQAAPPLATDDEDDSLLYGFRPRHADRGPAPRRVIDIAHDAIALMCEGMHLLGDRHAVYGFSGQGRLQVDIRVAKAFDEPWSARSAAALAALQPEGSTRTGAAIRHALAQLLAQPAQTRVLMVVTDGYPQDQDYGPQPRDRAYGLHDTAQALREAARAGVLAFCVSIDHAAHDYLRGVCPAHRYLVIDDVHRLPERLSRLYRRLTC